MKKRLSVASFFALQSLALLIVFGWVLASCGTETTPTYTVTTAVTPEGTGTVTHTPTGTSHDKGTQLSFTATASDGYLFSGWQGDLSGSSNPASLRLTKDVQVTALFEKKTYPLSVVVEDGGTVTEEVIQAKTDYDHGTVVRLTALPYTGWDFVSWSGDAEGTESTLDVTVTSEMTITATFEKQPMPLVLTIEGSGSVKATPEKDAYLPGDSLQLIANPDYGYRFLNWTYGDSTYQNDTVNVVVGTSLDIGVEFEYGEWVSKAYPMDDVNATSEMYFQNNLSPGFYETSITAREKGYDNADGYAFWDASKMHLDINGDGLLDMFAFLTNFKDEPWAKFNGKALLVLDVLGPNSEKKISEIENRWMPKIYLTDIEGDGRVELFLGGEEDHELPDGTTGDARPMRYLKFSDDGSFVINYFGPYTSYHDLAMGDVDNDGDIDIVINGQQSETKPTTPLHYLETKLFIYLNDGNGNFSYADQESYFKNYTYNVNYQFKWWTLDLFDFDGDGWLDLVGGQKYFSNDPDEVLSDVKPLVLWNQGDGTFDMQDRFVLPHKIDFQQFANSTPLGFNAFDYNNDGLLDIITAITPEYGGYIIQIHKNLGDRTFEDVTQEIVVGYHDTYTRGQCTDGTAANNYLDGDPSNFYNIRPIDKDGDGDYDLVPDNWATWDCEFNQDIYWENRDGKFYRSY